MTGDLREYISKLKKSKEIKNIANKEGLKFFAITIFYLFSLFSAMLIDNLILS